LIVPGGGYCVVSCTEGEIVAKEFYNRGYNAFVVTYTTNLLMDTPLRLQPLMDLSRAVVFVRKNAAMFQVDPNRLSVCGFSAGGHLCGSLAVHYGAPEISPCGDFAGISNRPDAIMLCYPVITSGKYAHRDSFRALLGEDAGASELEYMSLEKHVAPGAPPAYLWHTAADELVPVENSLLFAEACKNNAVPYELHIFASGRHGMSLANEEWAEGEYTGLYSMEQFFGALQHLNDRGLELPHPFSQLGEMPAGTDMKELFLQRIQKYRGSDRPNKCISVWPALADNWLSQVLPPRAM
jgi:acetyl esterase/lipase